MSRVRTDFHLTRNHFMSRLKKLMTSNKRPQICETKPSPPCKSIPSDKKRGDSRRPTALSSPSDLYSEPNVLHPHSRAVMTAIIWGRRKALLTLPVGFNAAPSYWPTPLVHITAPSALSQKSTAALNAQSDLVSLLRSLFFVRREVFLS